VCLRGQLRRRIQPLERQLHRSAHEHPLVEPHDGHT
jgi:hypothetical protein